MKKNWRGAITVVGFIGAAIISHIWYNDGSVLLTEHQGRPSVVIGLALVGLLLAVFGGIAYWLYFSTVPANHKASKVTFSDRDRLLLAGAALLGSLLIGFGGAWDANWHTEMGGFGSDFLWPPHFMLYGSFLLLTVLAGLFLGKLLFGRGDARIRVRSAPAVGILALASAYMIGSLPSDLIWHQIYGADIDGFSPPHIILTVLSLLVALTALVIFAGLVDHPQWGRWARWGARLVALPILWDPLLLISGEFDWGGHTPGNPTDTMWQRATWIYPFYLLVFGLIASLAVTAALKKRMGSATVTAITIFGLRVTMVIFAVVQFGPTIGNTAIYSQWLVIVPAVAFDLFLLIRQRQGLDKIGSVFTVQDTWRYGLLYIAVGWLFLVAATDLLNIGPAVTLADFVFGGLLCVATLWAIVLPIMRTFNQTSADATAAALPKSPTVVGKTSPAAAR